MIKPSMESSGTEFSSRQCARRNVHLEFNLGGVDDRGQFFEEAIITHDLGEGGGSFILNRSIPIGSTLRLADTAGFISLISIAWRNPQNHPSFISYGFRFVHPLEE